MTEREATEARERTVVYCVIPRDLAPRLHEPLRRHFAGGPRAVEVIVERRGSDRRDSPERRALATPADTDRRRVRNAQGRRIAERRAPAVAVEPPLELPRKARPHAGQIHFLERLEPSSTRLEDIDTARIVTRIQAGDDDAFALLYMRYFNRVYSYLRVLFRHDDHEAEDITQQVFMRVLEALPAYERRSQPFRAWLFTIVKNLAMTHLDRRSRSQPVEPAVMARKTEEQLEPLPAAAVEWLTDRELVLFVERLPLPQRQVLVLRYMLDLPTKEIARILGRTAVDVRTLEHRALRFLESRLRAVGRTPAPGRSGRALDAGRRTRWMPVLRQRRAALLR
jgi:RNA polymerase sigma-70 factor (ECF subfamily)